MARTKVALAVVRNPVTIVRATALKAKLDDMDDYLDAIGTVLYTASGAIAPDISLAILVGGDTPLAMTLADGTVQYEVLDVVCRAGTAVVVPDNLLSGSEIDLAAGDRVRLTWDGSAWDHDGAAAEGGEFTSVAHGQLTGAGPFYYASSGAIPTGLLALTQVWIITRTVDVFELASSHANALAGIPITITSGGSGTQTLTRLIPITAVDDTAETLTAVAHALPDEIKVRIEAQAGGTLPAPLAALTDYYSISDPAEAPATVDKFLLASSLVNAQADTAIDLTTNGVLPLRLLQLAFKTITAVDFTA